MQWNAISKNDVFIIQTSIKEILILGSISINPSNQAPQMNTITGTSVCTPATKERRIYFTA